jgi:hypothetical protein
VAKVINLADSTQGPAKLRALMLFPHDDSCRRLHGFIELLRQAVFNAEPESRINIPLASGTIWRMFLHQPKPERPNERSNLEVLGQAADEAHRHGLIAGMVLGTMYVMDRASFPAPSRENAIKYVQALAREARYGDGSPVDRSRTRILKHWQGFKSVAHLWAAYYLNLSFPIAPQKDLFGSHFIPFMQSAAALGQWGIDYRPVRAKKTILDPKECWGLPVRPKAPPVHKFPFPDRLLEILKPPPDEFPERLAREVKNYYLLRRRSKAR